MLKFVFLLTIWNAEQEMNHVYVVDSGLTGEDCIAAVENYALTNPEYTHGLPSCEIDHAEESQ